MPQPRGGWYPPGLAACLAALSLLTCPAPVRALPLTSASTPLMRAAPGSLLDREGEAQGTMDVNWLGTYDWRWFFSVDVKRWGAGVYFYRMEAGGYEATGRALMVQ